jgi:hypothetical protein
MNGRFQMQGGKNWFLPKEMNANRFFWDSHWLEIWSNHFYPSMGPNGGSVAMDSGNHLVLLVPEAYLTHRIQNTEYRIQNTAAVELKYTKLPIPVFCILYGAGTS